MSAESFETMLSGGHHNSLGKTIEVVEIVLSNPTKLEELYNCYFCNDEVVRLRTSNAVKRISKQHPDWLISYIDRFVSQISKIDQASAKWTLADLFLTLTSYMNQEQKAKAKEILKNNLQSSSDWIVLNNTMQTLAMWAKQDFQLQQWLIPQLDRLCQDGRKSVARRAQKLQAQIR